MGNCYEKKMDERSDGVCRYCRAADRMRRGDGTKSMMSADTAAAENGARRRSIMMPALPGDSYAMNDMAAAEEIAVEKSAKGGDTTANQTQNPEELTLLEENLCTTATWTLRPWTIRQPWHP